MQPFHRDPHLFVSYSQPTKEHRILPQRLSKWIISTVSLCCQLAKQPLPEHLWVHFTKVKCPHTWGSFLVYPLNISAVQPSLFVSPYAFGYKGIRGHNIWQDYPEVSFPVMSHLDLASGKPGKVILLDEYLTYFYCQHPLSVSGSSLLVTQVWDCTKTTKKINCTHNHPTFTVGISLSLTLFPPV